MLSVKGLSVRYGLLTAVRDVSIELEKGEVAAILGSNGAGKSSTLNAISGCVIPVLGRVSFNGTDITGWAPHKIARLGLVQVPEGRHIVGPLTVEENLLLGANYVRPRSERRARLADVYEIFPVLKERSRSYGGLLSGGEQQMLAFGRALMARPKALLLDEPSMGLAPIAIETVRASIAQIATIGISVLMVEQNAELTFGLAQSVHVLEHGSVVLSGPIAKVKNDPLLVRAFLGVTAK